GSTPDNACAILQERVHAPYTWVIIRAVEDEHRIIRRPLSVILIGWQLTAEGGRRATSGIESAEAAVSAYPVFARTPLQQVSDLAVRQSLFDAIIGECVTIIPRQPIIGAKPQEAARIAHNPVDNVLRQAVSRGVDFDRQALGEG